MNPGNPHSGHKHRESIDKEKPCKSSSFYGGLRTYSHWIQAVFHLHIIKKMDPQTVCQFGTSKHGQITDSKVDPGRIAKSQLKL